MMTSWAAGCSAILRKNEIFFSNQNRSHSNNMEIYNDPKFHAAPEHVKAQFRIWIGNNLPILQPYQMPQLDMRRIRDDPKYRVHIFLHLARMDDETGWKTIREIAFEAFLPHRHDAGQRERVVAYLNELLAEGVVIRRDDRWRVPHPLDE